MQGIDLLLLLFPNSPTRGCQFFPSSASLSLDSRPLQINKTIKRKLVQGLVGQLGMFHLVLTENAGSRDWEINKYYKFQQKCIVVISGVLLLYLSFCPDVHLNLGPPVGVLERIICPTPTPQQ